MLTTLVSASQLAALASDNIVILDCRHSLADPRYGEQAYAFAHIHGAHFVHLDRDLSGPCTGKNGRQETVARVQRRQREHKVQKQRGNDHRLETLEQKLAPHRCLAVKHMHLGPLGRQQLRRHQPCGARPHNRDIAVQNRQHGGS